MQHGAAADEDENVDVEGDNEMYEEYEWAGQRRIRATTLLVGGFAGEYSHVQGCVFHVSNGLHPSGRTLASNRNEYQGCLLGVKAAGA